jgi:glycerophosphoryl diester phosphodiesterase
MELREHTGLWSRMEVTSGEPLILRELRKRCSGLAVDFLHPLRESWMTPAVDVFLAIERSRLAGARAVHLHATQLTADAVLAVRERGIGVHAWGINDGAALATALELGITRVCTDQLALIQSALRRPPAAEAHGELDDG